MIAGRTAGRRTGGRQPLQTIGDEPDPRFTLANERTFLAWSRTALALVATGLAVVQFMDSQHLGVRLAIGIPLMLLGALISLRTYKRWEAIERALRLGRPLPYAELPRWLGVAIAVITVAACILLVARV
jgi:putative membrane protein